jgi:putative component of membrane protein insertase Oxa1/YidC/SpoIIIJ protein YidD
MTLTTYPALWSIQFYQRFISPYKGFRCAHATLHRGDSCSQAVKKIIIEHGIGHSRALIKARFAECRAAAMQLQLGQVLSTRDDEDEDTQRRKKRQELTNDCGCDIAEAGCDIVRNSLSCGGKGKRDCLPDVDCVPDCGCGF